MMNKRGQGLSINAIILIILAVVVLVVLILGFTIGWNKIAPWVKPSNNVNEISQACSVACNTGSTYDYCTLDRELRIEQNVNNFVNGEKYNCGELSGESSFGVVSCPTITCPSS